MVNFRQADKCFIFKFIAVMFPVLFSNIKFVCPFRSSQIDLVEILDTDSKSWRTGPRLPRPFHEAPMVQYPNGGVIYIIVNSIYYLPHAGPSAQWQLLPQKVTTWRRWFAALFIPDDAVACA